MNGAYVPAVLGLEARWRHSTMTWRRTRQRRGKREEEREEEKEEDEDEDPFFDTEIGGRESGRPRV